MGNSKIHSNMSSDCFLHDKQLFVRLGNKQNDENDNNHDDSKHNKSNENNKNNEDINNYPHGNFDDFLNMFVK